MFIRFAVISLGYPYPFKVSFLKQTKKKSGREGKETEILSLNN